MWSDSSDSSVELNRTEQNWKNKNKDLVRELRDLKIKGQKLRSPTELFTVQMKRFQTKHFEQWIHSERWTFKGKWHLK